MRCFCVLAGVPDPWCEKWETLYVTRVELTDTATVLSIVACGMEGDGVTLGSDREEGMYLLGRKSGRKYGYRGSAGLEVGKHHVFGATGNISMTLCFETIGKEEEAFDVVTGKDESLCVQGIRLQLPDSVRRLPECRLQGELQALLLWRWLDQDISMRNMKGVRVLPVVNGRFECEIPVEHEDDYYVFIPWNQWARRSFRHIELDKKERGIMVSPFSCLFLLV